MEYTMEFRTGDADLRPSSVRAVAARTSTIKAAERELELNTLVAVQRDGRLQLSCAAVLRDALRQLRIPAHELEVEGLSQATFLLRFRSPAARNAALSVRAFQVGNYHLNLMPWSRRIGASAGKLRFRVRVCLEGVPRHARSMAAVAQLFNTPSFVEEIDYTVEREEERFCFNVWIWTDAPNEIALQGTLQIQEPLVNSDDYCYQLGDMDAPFFRDGPAETFDYNVLIHLDRVLDYTPLPDSSGEQG
jgi:hypothetical protein